MNDTSITTIEEFVAAQEAQETQLKNQIKEKLLTMPDNPRINRIGDSPRCFTIKFSDLGTTNWTPFYQDFKLQYEKLAEVVGRLPLGSLTSNLYVIIKTKSYRDSSAKHTFHFHPDVIKNLVDLLGVKIKLASSN